MSEKKQKKRTGLNLNSAHVRYGGYNTVVAVVVLAILIVVNLLVRQLPSRYISIDTSSSGIYTLGDTTKNVVENLDLDVTVYVLAEESSADTTVRELLSRYAELSDHLSVQYIDTAADPSFANEYNASTATSGSLVVVSDKRSTLVDYSDLYDTTVDYYTYYTTGEYSSSTDFDGEGQITSAIDYVSSDTLPVLYTLTGHGESELSDEIISQVNKQNVEMESLNFLETEEVPEDASAILISQPTNDLSDDEKTRILSYLQAGGSVLYIPVLSTDGTVLENFAEILSYYGMSLTGTMVMEGDASMYYQYPYYLLPSVNSSSDITSPIADSGLSLLILEAQGIRVSEDLRASLTLTELVTTSEDAYGKEISGSLSTLEKEEGDEEGPFALAVSAEEEVDGGTSRLVVLSSQYLLDSSILNSFSVGNADLFLNSVSWMCEHESTISISAKSMDEATLVVSTSAARILQAVTMILIPVGLLIAGFAVWLWRRKK